jgi:hypothetical protein
MGLQEILFRARRAITPTPTDPKVDGKELIKYLRYINFADTFNDCPKGQEFAPQYINFANDQINGNFSIFEEKVVIANMADINWQRDYQTGKEAPLKPTSQLNYRDYDKIGNIKYIWEINRHQYLIPVAIAYFITGDEKYKDYVVAIIDNWIDKNPYQVGINWSSCLELAVRLISWNFAISFLMSRDENISESSLEKFSASVYLHAFHINRNPSLFSSANNHLIGELAGILSASTLLRGHSEISAWKDKAIKRLIEQVPLQVHADGVGAEQSPSYQAHTVGYYILAIFFLKQLNDDIPNQYRDLIDRSAEFYKSIMDVDGYMPNIGDNDGGIPIYLYARKSFNEYKSMINSSSILLNASLTDLPFELDENNYWLFKGRSEDLNRNSEFRSRGKSDTEIKKEFRDGGYYVLGDNFGSENELKVIFDCGPLGFLSIAAHGHADALSFVLTYGGDKFFIDPGTYKYFVDENFRDYFRSTSAHNTIRIDGIDQSEMKGPFLWGRRAKAVAGIYESKAEYDRVEGEHDGYGWLDDPVIHRRGLLYDKNTRIAEITDMVQMGKEHGVEQYFHIDKRCRVTGSGNCYELNSGDKTIRVTLDKKATWKLICGQENPMLGWQSEEFGDLAPCNTLVGSLIASKDTQLVTKIEIL